MLKAIENNSNAFIYASERLRNTVELKLKANKYIYPEDGVNEQIELNEVVWDRGYYADTEDGTWYNLFVTEEIKGYYPNERKVLNALNNFHQLDLSMYEEYNQINFFAPNFEYKFTIDEMTDILI